MTQENFIVDPENVTFEHMSMPVVPMVADEGTLDVSDRIVTGSGATRETHGFANPISEGDHLEAFGDFAVRSALANVQTIIGFAQENPGFGEGVEVHELTDVAGSPFADPQKRIVPVEMLGAFIRTVDLVTGTVAVGDSIAPDAAVRHRWALDGSPNAVQAIVLIGGTAPAKITAMWGFFGRH